MVLLVGLIGFIISSTLLLLFKPLLIQVSLEKSALFVSYINYLFVLIFFQIFFSILDVYYSALLNSTLGTYLREVFQRVLIILLIGCFFFDLLTFHQFVLAYIAALSVPTFYIMFSLIKAGQFSLKTDFSFLDNAMIKSVLSVSVFSILNGFSMNFIQNIDTIMITKMVGLSGTGIYGICFFFGVVIAMPSRSIFKIANVVSAEAWKTNDMKTISDIYEKSCLTLFIIGSLLFLALWVNIDNVFHVIGPAYSSGKWVIFFIGLGNLIDMATGANSSIFGTSKYYKVQTVLLVLLVLLLIVTNLWLIPKFGITGAAIGGAASLTMLNLLRYLFLLYKYKLQPYNIRFLYVLLISLAAYFIASSLPVLSNFIVDIIVRSSILALIFCLPIYLFKISIDINQKADEILRKFKLVK
jgi:O-antigen/teichoic acid export membrane protein